MIIKRAYIEITNSCNLNCLSCYNRSGQKHKKNPFPPAQIKVAINRLINEFGCRDFSISGGEPTLHPNFPEIIECIMSYPNTTLDIVTNGTTKNKYLSSAYKKYPDLHLQISLDGSTETINSQTRGSGTFNLVLDFLKTLDYTLKKPRLKMVISQNNFFDIQSFYELAISLECIPLFDFINNMGNATDNWHTLELSPKHKLQVINILCRLNDFYNMDTPLPLCTFSCPLANKQANLSVLIKTDGSIQPCQIMYNPEYSIGNIVTDTKRLIQNEYNKIHEMASKRSLLVEDCKSCVVKDHCKRGCMALALMNDHSPFANDGECEFRKIQFLGYHAQKAIKDEREQDRE